jgi:hypothetical protein
MQPDRIVESDKGPWLLYKRLESLIISINQDFFQFFRKDQFRKKHSSFSLTFSSHFWEQRAKIEEKKRRKNERDRSLEMKPGSIRAASMKWQCKDK